MELRPGWVAFWIVLAVAVVLGAPLAGLAAAQNDDPPQEQEPEQPAPACLDPEALDASGLSQPEREVRELRAELRALCAVLAHELGRVDAALRHDERGLGAVREAVADVGAAVRDVQKRLDSPVDVTPTVGVAESEPLQVSDAGVAAEAGEGFAALHSGLWFLGGLLASALGAYALYRLVMPRA